MMVEHGPSLTFQQLVELEGLKATTPLFGAISTTSGLCTGWYGFGTGYVRVLYGMGKTGVLPKHVVFRTNYGLYGFCTVFCLPPKVT